MANGDLVVDICKHVDAAALKALVEASQAYWTSPSKGYQLISDDVGKDFVRAFESAITNGAYDQGTTKYLADGEVILVYQR
jgi:hypothetical protein